MYVIENSPSLPTMTADCPDPPGNNALADMVVSALEAARPLLLTGLPELGIPPLDPLGPLPSLQFHFNNEALVLVP